MNPNAIYSKTGKGVQEASGRTSHLSRADRAVLSAIDGKSTVEELNQKFDKYNEAKFHQLIEKMDKDGFVREVSAGTRPMAAPKPAAAKPAGRAAPPPPKQEEEAEGEELDFTSFVPSLPKATQAPKPGVDLAAKAHADAERKAEDDSFDYRAREEAEAKAKSEAAARAKAEAEAKAQAEAAARAKAEAEAKAKAAAEARAKAEAEAKAKAEAEERAHKETEAKSKAVRDAAVRAASEARQKAEAEAKAKAEAEERANREAEERARVEKELSEKLDAERKAREEAERKAKEEGERLAKEAEERARKEAEEKARQESESLRKQLEEERKAREEAERKAREEAERARKEAEEQAKRREEEAENKRKEEARRKEEEEAKRKADEEAKRKEAEEAKREAEEKAKGKEAEEAKRKADEEAKRKEAEEAKRKADEEAKRKEAEEAKRKADEEAKRKEAEEAKRKEEEEAKRKADEEAKRKEEEAQKAKAAPAALPDDLLADLDSFAQRDEQEAKAREAAERKAKEDAARKAKEDAERKAKEEEARKRRDEEARARREEEERREREEEARRREAEEQAQRDAEERERREAEERRRAAQETLARAAQKPSSDDIDISDEDLDLDEVRRDERALSKQARAPAAERVHEEDEGPAAPQPAAKRVKRRKLGMPIGIAAAVLLVVGVGVLHVMPLSPTEYESAASASLGVPVKVRSAGMSLITGPQVKLEGITIGSGDQAIRIASARASTGIGGLFGAQKAFGSVELEGVVLPQALLGDALFGALKGGAMSAETVIVKQATLEGPLTLPKLDATLRLAGDGRVASATLRGGDGFEATLKGKGSEAEISGKAAGLTLPFLPAMTLTDVAFNGSVSREALRLAEWDGRIFDGVITGSLELRWGAQWSASGTLVSKGVNAAVFAPALLSEGKADGEGRFSMTGADPAALAQSARLEGKFAINRGVLGSFDLSRGIQTKGKQASGRTLFSELSADGSFEAGAVTLSKINIGAGKLNAAGNLDISSAGGLSGRIVADVESGPRAISATLKLVGTLKEPRLTE